VALSAKDRQCRGDAAEVDIADLYENDGRRPTASINFITAHDGFTLADLVSFNAIWRTTRTAPTTTAHGTAARKGQPTTLRSTR
jgi:hypothetical protein